MGKAIVIGGRDAVVTGVAPQGFRGLRGGEINDGSGFAVYVPLAHARDWPGARPPEQQWLNVYGRLTVPMDGDRLAAELLPVAGRIEASNPVARRNARIAVTDSWLTPSVTMPMLWFMYLSLLSEVFTSPFSIHAKVRDGKIVYFQFMEDTFESARSFSTKGKWTMKTDPNGPEFEV